ncbi:arsenate reductase (azurin) large subunit [Pseudoroseomonas cervicalis]|uniref:Arsenite oxidase, large subunit n=2 Tax=Teichococcus cervicalis TaxID=204525 RepID=D5RQT8_9PROT|nr:arsenate reductase (azurin) large subunit [Pseudoroseomonas cervicalis]EFH10338.1 arsenite oxidase, large subunit [Pseudoroseomonas cervicalis ATCC 49957]
MAYKRNIDRLPIPPRDARVNNVVCHYCIVGCGYKAYSWPVNRQGGPAPGDNAFGEDMRAQLGADSAAWVAPSMYNVVRQNGQDVHIVIKPDHDCVVNSGLGSIRGARMAEMSYSTVTGTQQARLTDPLVWRYGTMSPASWDDSVGLVAEVTRRVIEEQGEDGLLVSAYDHGGAGGGYENTWATGKLYFQSMKVKNIRIHNRPAYNSEVHGSRDMGVGELNNCYEDAELADTLFIAGANSLETQTNYFLNHWVPNLRGSTLDKKQSQLPNEPHAAARIVVVDPRRTVTIAACEAEAGKENVLHLRLNSGTDLVLFNALFTEIAARGWTDKAFIAASTSNFDAAVGANRTTVEEAARLTGVSAEDIRKAAAWIAEPKQGGARRRTMFAYEKGIIWGNDNYRTNQSLVNIALATGNIGRPGGGCVRLGGHQEGYARPSDAHVGKPAQNVDELLIGGRGGVHHVWGCDHFKTTLNASEFKRVYQRRTNMVKEAMDSVPAGDRAAQLEAIIGAIRAGGLFSVNVDIVPTQIGSCAHVVLPAATSGEMNLTSMNGERRMRLTERYMDPPGNAMPDCLIVARLAQALERSFRTAGNAAVADRFRGYDWKTEEEAFMDGYHRHEKGGEFVTYARLRAMGTNGFQEPAVGLETTGAVAGGTTTGASPGMVVQGPAIEGARGREPVQQAAPHAGATGAPAAANGGSERILGTQRLYADGKFNRPDGRAVFAATQWRGLQAEGKQAEKDSHRFLVNNGRANHVWQSAYLDQHNDFVRDRFPYPYIGMNPDDMGELALKPGDLVEVFNGNGATQAVAWPEAGLGRNQTFMLFGYPTGVQGNVVSKATNELIIPNYKQTWANIRKLSDAPEAVRHLSWKSQEYRAQA